MIEKVQLNCCCSFCVADACLSAGSDGAAADFLIADLLLLMLLLLWMFLVLLLVVILLVLSLVLLLLVAGAVVVLLLLVADVLSIPLVFLHRLSADSGHPLPHTPYTWHTPARQMADTRHHWHNTNGRQDHDGKGTTDGRGKRDCSRRWQITDGRHKTPMTQRKRLKNLNPFLLAWNLLYIAFERDLHCTRVLVQKSVPICRSTIVSYLFSPPPLCFLSMHTFVVSHLCSVHNTANSLVKQSAKLKPQMGHTVGRCFQVICQMLMLLC